MSIYKLRYAGLCLVSGVILLLSACHPTVVVADNSHHSRRGHYHYERRGHHPQPAVRETIIVH